MIHLQVSKYKNKSFISLTKKKQTIYLTFVLHERTKNNNLINLIITTQTCKIFKILETQVSVKKLV